MNIGELKAFLGEKQSYVGRSELQNQLRETGLRQAASQQQNAVTLSNAVESRSFVSLKVFSGALNESLTLDGRRPNLGVPKAEQAAEQKSLFDFEEVARNVLRFVGGAIKHAQAKGMDNDELTKMFEQARNGVAKGIKMAEKDLAGLMNDEISSGISKSREMIEEGIEKLERDVFGKNEEGEQDQVSQLGVYQSVSYSREDRSELSVRTHDGDEVTIRFEDLRQFELNRSLLISSGQQNEEAGKGEIQPVPIGAPAGQGVITDQQAAAESDKANEENDGEQRTQGTSPGLQAQQNYLYYERAGFSFSVQGSLDEGELDALGELVGNAAELADEFFNGDVEKAFNQALELGFNESELTGYALQLTRHEQVRVIQTYEAISHNEEKGATPEASNQVKPVAHYLERMLDVVEQSREQLENGRAYENLINGLVNKVLNLETPELISAINRFHSFNQRLLDNLPSAVNAGEAGSATETSEG
ncbi:DUF5610 domain-containing protein [Bowmanella dokdonensis]|uniref:DUF5610 domain-containing protein n=1 Tax=Bowmanella dokdonensis TaxID=751969 RepID=A0A939DT16_9ALTE|nr:DUF5610 domain-containing protein [Bowmanella dokdonensis]MBN7827406.1 DUF5610 domain-containing protein [Bowmanella dokdonensis]